MFSKFTGALLLVTAPAGVWLAAQPAPVAPIVQPADVHAVDAASIGRQEALSTASDFFAGDAITSARLNHDAELDRLVWRVSDGKETVRIDADSGDIVELAW